jgi:hypothetical protein
MEKTHFLIAAVMLFSALNPGARAEEKSVCLEGFDPGAPKTAAYIDKYINYEKKQNPSLWEYPHDGSLAVTWTSQSVPSALRGKPVMFAVEAGIGSSKGADGWHEFSVNGKKVLRFNTPYGEKIVWRDHDCTVTFHPLRVDENDDLLGIMYLEIAPAYLNYGQPQTFSVRGEDNNAKTWFMLFEGKAAGINIEALQQKNEVRKRIISIKSVFIPPDTPVECIAKWQGMKQAAWSASIAPVKSANVVNIVVSGKAEEAIRKEIEAAIAGHGWINEVYPDHKSLQNIPAAHAGWLQKMDCVLWESDPEKIQQYVESRKNFKVSLVSKGDAGLLVTLLPENKAKAAGAVTLQIPLPEAAWNVEVFINGVKTAANFIYLKDDKGVSFDLEAGKSAEINIKKQHKTWGGQ